MIIDRAKDVGKLSDGTPFAPQFIENKLKFSPFIGEAVAFGDGRPFVAAMIAIDLTTVRQLGRAAQPRLYLVPGSERQAGGARADPRGDPEMQRVVACRRRASGRFVLLNKEFDADDNEITRTHARSAAASSPRNTPPSSRRSTAARAEVELVDRDHLRGRAQGDAQFHDRDRRRRGSRQPAREPAYA